MSLSKEELKKKIAEHDNGKNSVLQHYVITKYRMGKIEEFSKSIPANLKGYDVMKLTEMDSDYDKLSPVGKTKIREYLDNPTLFMLLQGGSGLGKTSIAAGVCFEMLRRGWGYTAEYREVSTLLNEFSFGNKGLRGPEIIEKAVLPDILLLDDVGAGTTISTPTRITNMQSLINKRWEQDKFTIMTTNLAVSRTGGNPNEASIQDWFGESAWDRIAGSSVSGDSNLTRITFGGKTMRGQSSRRGTRR